MSRWTIQKRFQNKKLAIIPAFIGVFAVIGVTQLLFSHASQTVQDADLNRDGVINILDLSIALSNVQHGVSQASEVSGLIGYYGQAAPLSTTGVQAAQANDFLNTVGVNIHPSHFDTSYNNWNAVVQKLQELKLRQVRSSAFWQSDPGTVEVDRRQDQLIPLGIKAEMILGTDHVPEQIAYIKSKPAGFVSAVETNNEPDCFLSKKDSNWVANTRLYQQNMYNALKADNATKNIPILSTPYCRAATPAAVGDLSAWFDTFNGHPYPGGQPPEDRIAASITEMKQLGSNKPIMATETGYYNAMSYVEGGETSEAATAIYMPRLFLSYYAAGIKQTYLYELVEPRPSTWISQMLDRDNHFGLYRANFEPKPAATSLRRLMTVLNDSEGSFTPGKLDYHVSGDTSNLQQVLLQKRDGTFYLMLWRKDSVWNVGTLSALPITNKPLTVSVSGGVRQVTSYNVNQSDNPLNTSSSATVNLSLGPEVQILEIKR